MYFNGIQFDAPDDAVADARCGFTLKGVSPKPTFVALCK